jgi:hypothetical protein
MQVAFGILPGTSHDHRSRRSELVPNERQREYQRLHAVDPAPAAAADAGVGVCPARARPIRLDQRLEHVELDLALLVGPLLRPPARSNTAPLRNLDRPDEELDVGFVRSNPNDVTVHDDRVDRTVELVLGALTTGSGLQTRHDAAGRADNRPYGVPTITVTCPSTCALKRSPMPTMSSAHPFRCGRRACQLVCPRITA